MSTVTYVVQNILKDFSSGDYYEELKTAYTLYEEMTAKCHSSSEEYEGRMNSFNEWYIFHYKLKEGKEVFAKYFDDHGIDSPMAESFFNVNFSVFRVHKASRGRIHLYDILHGQRIKVAEGDTTVAIVPEDTFVGRTISFEGRYYLLKGITTLPRESVSEIEKACKFMRRKKLFLKEEKFLLNLEKLKMRSLNYRHLTPAKIFNEQTLQSVVIEGMSA